jgi:serine/threonine protein phosphatase PrpC
MRKEFFTQLKNSDPEGAYIRPSTLAQKFGFERMLMREILLEWATRKFIKLEAYSEQDSRFHPVSEWKSADEFFEYGNHVGQFRVKLLPAGDQDLDRLKRSMERPHKPIAERLSSWLARPTKATAYVDLPELPASIATTVGEVRRENQDRAVIARYSSNLSKEDWFVACLLADGMGGMVDGARCAEIALGTFIDTFIRSSLIDVEERLRIAADAANDQVYGQFRQKGGTTIAGVIFSERGMAGISAGDSRLHSFSRSGRLRQISVDDTIAAQVKRVVGIEPTDDQADIFAAELVQYVGLGRGMEPHTYPLKPMSADEKYLITSDGAHGVPVETLESIVTHAPSLLEAAKRTMFISNWCGGKDNASIICVDAIVPSSLAMRQRPEPGLVEIWDSFGKLELFIEERLVPDELNSLPREQQFVPQFQQSDQVRVAYGSSSRSSASKTRKRQKRREPEKPPHSLGAKPEPRTLQIEILQAGEPPRGQTESAEPPNAAAPDTRAPQMHEPTVEQSSPEGQSHTSSYVGPVGDGADATSNSKADTGANRCASSAAQAGAPDAEFSVGKEPFPAEASSSGSPQSDPKDESIKDGEQGHS